MKLYKMSYSHWTHQICKESMLLISMCCSSGFKLRITYALLNVTDLGPYDEVV